MPTHAVVLGKELPDLVGDEKRISVVFDWCESLPQQQLLFLELGPAGAAACRFLAGELRHCVQDEGTGAGECTMTRQRPVFATTSELAAVLKRVVYNRIADDLIPALADYLLRAGVIEVASPGSGGGQSPTRAQLHAALAEFAGTRRCPPILRYVIPGLHGQPFAAMPPHHKPDPVEVSELLAAEHPSHVTSLVDFGERAEEVCRSIELCVLQLPPDPAHYPRPSPLAAAMGAIGATEGILRDLTEQSAKLTDIEKIRAFRERLGALRWKHTLCKEGWRPASAPIPPHPGIQLPSATSESASDPEEPEQPPIPDAAAQERMAWEREASEARRRAHAIPWQEVIVPVVQSCRDVGELAVQHAAGEDLVAPTQKAARELLHHALVEPSLAAMEALDGIEAGLDRLAARIAAAAQPGRDSAPAADKRRADRPELSDTDILVIRALPKSTEPGLRTLASIAARVGTKPTPSTSTMSRSISRLRSTTPPLVDAAAYRRSKAGDAAEL